jgi:hypothetical protein
VENKEKAIFKGPTGSLRIGVERYQFPEITDGYWDQLAGHHRRCCREWPGVELS